MNTQLSKRTEHCERALIAFGANQHHGQRSPAASVKAAIAALEDARLQLCRASALYVTPSFPPGSGPDFVNGCAEYSTDYAPQELLARLLQVEAGLGRDRRERWGARIIDLDLLALGDRVLPDADAFRRWQDLPLERQMREAPEELILPHPRLQDRAFVLVPLADVAPGWRHPVLGRTVGEMLEALPEADRAGIRRLAPG
jgi:2-amino-4-hydroxy-6-hydroxymethyldihydropteridine diphosphokinase